MINCLILLYFCKGSDKIDPKWKGILNPPVCRNAVAKFPSTFCDLKNVAVVYPTNQYTIVRNQIKCPTYELSEFYSNSYGTFLLSNGFKNKEKLNQAYLRMREVGVVDRASKKSGIKRDSLKNFQAHYSDKYNVQDEGVMFEHVKYIVIGYFMFLSIPLIILLMEIVTHKYMDQIMIFINRW